ncbi:hypothetical protein EA462_15865 [Natrarchaeobius halalkaliphilus]|uniref:Proton-conducting membrane transporter n=1 Tax=Natrarchaeobius halalkaliphilus TaxID=1679091 RepID=A0A3N6MS98_9EURY|nr:hypothetical protein EA462_15865 [Natrarchaeobius halalkaliphilus]
MTTGPKLRLGGALAPGILAVILFAMMGAIALNTQFGQMSGYPEGISITSEIGYAMFDLSPLQSTEEAMANTESFLAAFLLIAVALDAALDASLVLAKREEGDGPVAPLSTQSSGATERTGGDQQ